MSNQAGVCSFLATYHLEFIIVCIGAPWVIARNLQRRSNLNQNNEIAAPARARNDIFWASECKLFHVSRNKFDLTKRG